MLCRDVFRHISEYMITTDIYRTLDLVCKSSHGLDIRRDDIVRILVRYNSNKYRAMIELSSLRYNDVFKQLYHDNVMCNNAIIYTDNYTLYNDLNIASKYSSMYKIVVRCIMYNAINIISHELDHVSVDMLRLIISSRRNDIFKNVYRYDPNYITMLYYFCIIHDNLELMQYCYSRRSDNTFDTIDNTGWLFMEACVLGKLNIAQWLYSLGLIDITIHAEPYAGSNRRVKSWLRKINCPTNTSYITFLRYRSMRLYIMRLKFTLYDKLISILV